MDFIETPRKSVVKSAVEQLPKPTEKRKKTMKNKSSAPVAKQPKSIKLSTIWKALVYLFAAIGVILSVMYVNDIVNDIVDSRAEAKVQEILKTRPAVETEPTKKLKANQ